MDALALLLAAPFSYGTSIVLARAGPEVIGTYGLLLVYIGVSFLPALLWRRRGHHQIHAVDPVEKRFPFCISYFRDYLRRAHSLVGIA